MEDNKLNYKRLALYLKIGIIGAVIILAGDMLMGWGLKDPSKTGIELQLSQYLNLSETRMILAAVFGFSGVPLACIGHYAIYKMLKVHTDKYAKLYLFGILGFLAFGGAGVHVSSVEAAYFYQNMLEAGANFALDSTIKFASYFLLPLYVILIIAWLIMVYAHIKAIKSGLSPLPRWFWIFSMPVGTLLFSLFGIIGNYEIINAIVVGAFSLGNIYSLTAHLWMVNKLKENN